MDWTNATVIINAADQATAQAFLPDLAGCFVTGASASGAEPATNYFTSGPFANDTLDALANEVTFQRTIKFGTDWAAHLASKGLQMIVQQKEGSA